MTDASSGIDPSPPSPTTAASCFPALPAELTIYTASDVRRDWLSWCDARPAHATEPVRVDGSAVEAVDGAGLQLLLALRHSLQAQGGSFGITGASEVLRGACATVGTSMLLATEQPA